MPKQSVLWIEDLQREDWNLEAWNFWADVARKPPNYVKWVRLIHSLDCLKNEYLQFNFIIQERNIKSKDWTSIVSCHCKKTTVHNSLQKHRIVKTKRHEMGKVFVMSDSVQKFLFWSYQWMSLFFRIEGSHTACLDHNDLYELTLEVHNEIKTAFYVEFKRILNELLMSLNTTEMS